MNLHLSQPAPALLRQMRAGLLVVFLALDALRPIAAVETNTVSNIGLKLVAENLKAPTALVSIPDGSGRLLVADQAGLVQLIDQDGKMSGQPFLDVRPKLVAIGQGMEERGLLGLAPPVPPQP